MNVQFLVYGSNIPEVISTAQSYFVIPHAHHRGGITNMRVQINNYPACIIMKSYFC